MDDKHLQTNLVPFQELNVKSLTTSTDKEKYGARLHAEPDHRILGTKLKQDFKDVKTHMKCDT